MISNRYTEIEIANKHANITTKECIGCAGDSPRTPQAGQKLLIPPCIWAEGCRAVIPLNATGHIDDALKSVRALDPSFESVRFPYTLSTGEVVGPGESAYVYPCKIVCCQATPPCAQSQQGC